MKLIKVLLSWDESQSSHRIMMLIVLTLGLLNFFWGEKVPAGNGFGWDGVHYGEMVRNLPSMISEGQLSSYYAQRILPVSIVRALLDMSGATLTNTNIISGFELYNLTLLLGACWIWKRLADKFLLSISGRWIGFSGIFINFQASKQAFYYPVLTDVTALFVAMLLLLFYVEKKPLALFAVTIIGAFSWPVVSICGALLLLFLKTELPKEIIAPAAPVFNIDSLFRSSLVRFGGLVLLFLWAVIYIAATQAGGVSEHICNAYLPNVLSCSPEGFAKLFTALSSILVILVAFAMLMGSRASFGAIIGCLKRLPLPLVILSIAAVLIPFFMVKVFSNPELVNAGSLKGLIYLILFPQPGKHLLPFVTLASFWGPVVLLLMLFWNQFCIEARKLGPGVVAIIGISLILGLTGEPRFVTIGWPFLVLGIVLVLEVSSTKPSFKYVFAVLVIVYAQFWIRLNYAPWLPPDFAGLQEFPKQLYFMHYGVWMSWLTYCIQLIALIFSAIWLRKSVIKVG